MSAWAHALVMLGRHGDWSSIVTQITYRITAEPSFSTVTMTRQYVSGSSKIQTLLPSNVIEISPQGFKFCNSAEKYQLFLDGNNVWILLEPLTYITGR